MSGSRRSLRECLSAARDWFRREELDRELREELAFHRRMLERDHLMAGMDEAGARAGARRRLGDSTRIVEFARDVWTIPWMDDLSQDVRFALRSLARSPGWAAAVVSIVTLGVAAAVAVFSVVQSLLIRPIDYPDASRIAVARRTDFSVQMSMAPTHAYVDAWRRSARSIDAIAAFARREVQVARGGVTTLANAALIDTGFLAFAGAHPVIGRNFSADEMATGGPRVVLLSERFWREQLGGTPTVLDSTMRIGDEVATIVGVLPATLKLPDADVAAPDIWLPLVRSENARLAGAVVRIRTGASRQAAEAELDSIDARAGIRGPGDGYHFVTRLVKPSETVRLRSTLMILSGAVAVLLIIACVNVAHLMLVRGATRERELATRHALGASRGRILRQLLTESLMLSGLGSAIALFVAYVALRLVVDHAPQSLTALSRVSMNASVIGAAVLFSVVAGLAFGLLAGARAVRAGLTHAFRANAGLTRGGRRLQATFIVSEIALSAALLVCALTLVRAIVRLQSVDVGFDARRLYALTVPYPAAAGSPTAREAFAHQVLERGRALPGVRAVTLAGSAPPSVTYVAGLLQAEGAAVPQGPPVPVTADVVASNYFGMMSLRLVGGRTFDASQSGAAQQGVREVVISEALAKQLWPAGSPSGRRFRVTDGTATDDAPWLTVVGVTRQAALHGPLEDATQPAMYLPLHADIGDGPARRLTLIVRMSGDASTPVEALRRLGAEVSSAGAAPRVIDVERAMDETIARPRFATVVLTGFAVVAVLLAALGLYAVVSFTVSQRAREIGIRITLGATSSMIARLVVANGLAIAAVGVVAGLAGAIATSRALAASVDGVTGADVVSFVLGAAALVLISLTACIVPAMRAAAIDPAVSIRAE